MKRATVLAALFCVSVMVATSLVCIADCVTNDSASSAYNDGCEENKTTFWEGNLQYIVNSDGKSVRVNHWKGDEVEVPDTVTHGGREYVVNCIAQQAFYEWLFPCGWDSPKKVVIGHNVEEICSEAFLKAGEGFTLVFKDIEISKLRVIGEGAFKESLMDEIELPASVELIKTNAFRESCLDKVTIHKDPAKKHSLRIDDYAFCDCHSLKSIDLGTATSIGKRAFEGCWALKDLDLSSAEHIYKNTFKGVRDLEHITFGMNLKHVAGNTFQLKFFDLDGKEFKFGDPCLNKLRGKDFIRGSDGCMHEAVPNIAFA